MEGEELDPMIGEDKPQAALDLHEEVIARYKNSAAPEHQRLCAVVGAIAQVLKDQGLPASATAYFAAAMSSLERQCNNSGAAEDPVTTALCTFLAMVLPRTPLSVLKSKARASLTLLVTLSGKDTICPGTLKAALSCIAFMLRVADKSDWPSIAAPYAVLVKHCIDRRPKIRKRAHQCTAEVLSLFQGSQLLSIASEAIVSLLEQSLMVVGGRNGVSSTEKGRTGSEITGALEVLHILNAFKLLLPLMSGKSIGKSLVHFITLLEFQQPFLTREVLNTVQPLFTSATADIPAKDLVNALGKLTVLLDQDKKAVDESTIAARVLLYGMKRLHTIDQDASALTLPTVFHSLAGLLASEHAEAMFGAAECLKNLIQSCIDETMIQKGVYRSDLVGESWNSCPTPIERVCAIADIILGYQYGGAWDMSLQVISALFDKLGRNSFNLMAGTVRNLADLQELSDENMTCRKQLHQTIGSAIAAMGPDQFLTLLPLDIDCEDLSKSKLWLLPILKQHIVGSRLTYFAESILPLALRLQERAQKYSADGQMVAARKSESCAQSLWALLPSFCRYPRDTAESFYLIAKALGDALSKESKLRGIICHSLQVLIEENKEACGYAACAKRKRCTEDAVVDRTADENVKAYYTESVAIANLKVISSFSRNFLPLLFNIFIASPADKRGDLQDTIGGLASIADKSIVKSFFVAVMQKLLKSTKDASGLVRQKGVVPMDIIGPNKEESVTSRRCVFMDLAASLLEGLDEEGVNMLFTATKPALQDGEGAVQKKAYKVLAILCKDHAEFLVKRAREILELLLMTMPSCHFSARRHRLNCLIYLILHLFQSGEQRTEEVLSSFISEIVLATKESNKKTRNAAYDSLVQLGYSLSNANNGASRENLLKLFNMVVGCLAGTTPHMISAAVTGLARLIYEFADLCDTIPDLMPSIILLLRSKNREVIKSVLGLIKVAAARQPVAALEQHLQSMVKSLLLWSDDSKNHFKAKVRIILEMLVQRCGTQAISLVMPEQHMKLLVNIQKRKKFKEKRKSSMEDNGLESKSILSDGGTARHSRWSHRQYFSDDNGEDDDSLDNESSKLGKNNSLKTSQTKSQDATSRSRKQLKKSLSMRQILEGPGLGDSEPLDLLNIQRTRSALSVPKPRKMESRSDDLEIAPDGRIIVPDNDHNGTGQSKRKRHGEDTDDERKFDSCSARSKYSGASNQHRKFSNRAANSERMRVSQRKKKKLDVGWAYTGEEYANKKGTAQGDVKGKRKLEPYAYWPLDPKMLNRRKEKKVAARKGLSSVLMLTKKMQGMSATKALRLRSTRQGKPKPHKGFKGKNKGKSR